MPRDRKLDQRGQGMTEYILIVALVAIAAIGVVGIFGDNIRAMMGTSVDALDGQATSDTGATRAGASADHRNVTNFGDDLSGAGSTDPAPQPPPPGPAP